ncbi:hypothetical protein VZT92_006994 [Zoarces viviparus]|uniref:Uncharacterized protein n=1 Tax=Zoarces viviparus TaxID=48416 RepID=A0AAW1FK12_ZOAVI
MPHVEKVTQPHHLLYACDERASVDHARSSVSFCERSCSYYKVKMKSSSQVSRLTADGCHATFWQLVTGSDTRVNKSEGGKFENTALLPLRVAFLLIDF